MQVRGFGRTDVGLSRQNNEDAFLVDEELGLFIVCDGMGGHAGGEVASDTASRVMAAYMRDRAEELETADDDRVGTLLNQAVQAACLRVYELSQEMPKLAGMGTTLTALFVRGPRGYFAHVGDSRLYLQRAGEVHQLTEDHTYVNELVKTGRVTREQAEKIVGSHAITRAVGLQDSVLVDHMAFDVLCNDTYMLCSDGLANYVESDAQVGGWIDTTDLEEAASTMINFALDSGGSDNVTAVVVDVQPEDELRPEEEKHESEITFRTETLRNVTLFQHLSMPERVSLLSYVNVESVPSGTVILRENEPGSDFFVVLEGSLSVTVGDRELAVLEYGDHFGEMAVLSKRPRSATVTARDDARLMRMTRDEFSRLVRMQPDIGVKLLWNVAQVLSLRLDEATDSHSPIVGGTGAYQLTRPPTAH